MTGVSSGLANDVAVVGAGIIGLTTAYVLAAQGRAVTLIEADSKVAAGCSYSNAALLTPAMSYPLNGPGSTAQFFRSFLPGQSAFSFEPTAALPFVGWGLSFLRKANSKNFSHATAKNFALASYSVKQTALLNRIMDVDFDNSKLGSLKVYFSMSDYAAARNNLAHFDDTELSMRFLDSKETCELEPLLSSIGSSIAGSIHYDQDESGDSAMFARRIAEEFLLLGGKIRFDTRVHRIVTENGAVASLETSNGAISAEKIIIATGHDVNALLSDVGSKLPIAPLKGITITIDGAPSDFPSIPIVDAKDNVVLTRLGNRLRVSGFAEMTGTNKRIPSSRVRALLQTVERLFPDVVQKIELDKIRPWAGLRPVSVDGVPIIGETSTKNLYVNAGHGHLGWTMAVGSAKLMATHIANIRSDIDATPYLPSRF